MSIEWPITLPDRLLQDECKETLPKNTIRQDMDVGPAKIRRRGTAAVGLISGRLLLTTIQTMDLDAFYNLTTLSGSLAFDWINIRTGVAASMRFLSPPSYAPAEDKWWADLELEILP